jgi:diguanylate cyclase (GGDEF)-like protein/PAS domain S-box-containing protein
MPSEIIDSGFRHVLNAITDGVYVTTAEREIVFWSDGAERITGYSADEVVGKHCYDDVLIHTDTTGRRLCFDGCPLQDCIKNGVERVVNEVFLMRKDGTRLPVYVKTTVFEEDGRTLGVEIFGELESVAGSDLAAQVQELTDSSITDPLTGLFNRRYFDAALDQQFAMLRRMGRRYGMLYIDVDDFKTVNDTLGHAGGDEALKFIASVIERSARKMDVVARCGGDEFVMLCAVSSEDELEAAAQRIVGMVRDSRFRLGHDAGVNLTVSLGGSLVAANDSDARQCLDRADEAMYRVKDAGRNGVALATAGGNDETSLTLE